MYATMRMTPALSAAATIASASRTVVHMGFSTNTCFPASAAAMVGGACETEGQTITPSMSLRTRSWKSAKRRAACTPYSEPTAPSSFGEDRRTQVERGDDRHRCDALRCDLAGHDPRG